MGVFEQFAHSNLSVVSDKPITSRRDIGVHRVEKDRQGNRYKLLTDHTIWYTFHGQAFDNDWTDEDVLALAQPHFGDVSPLRSFVVRGLRSCTWKCVVTAVFPSSQAATLAAANLRLAKWRAGVHAPKSIVDKVIHHIGTRACSQPFRILQSFQLTYVIASLPWV
jgi:hypothetical protein